MFRLTLLFFFFISLICGASSKSWDWSRDAVRLTGESDFVREQALRRLKRHKELPGLLRQALQGSQQAQALDVISALHMDEMLPDLMQAAASDQTGFVYLAINNLITSANKNQIVAFYEHNLFCPSSCQASGPAQVVILDTLSRLRESYSPHQLEMLMRSSWPEVRFSVLDYVRAALLQRHQEQYLPLLKQALHGEPVQLREQALFLTSELPLQEQHKILLSLENCQGSFGPTARNLCEKIKTPL